MADFPCEPYLGQDQDQEVLKGRPTGNLVRGHMIMLGIHKHRWWSNCTDPLCFEQTSSDDLSQADLHQGFGLLDRPIPKEDTI